MKRINLRREDGVAMTEFALIVPVFLLIVAGLLGFGRVFFYWIEANHLASETARWAVVDRNPYAPEGASPPGAGGKTLQRHAKESATVEFESDASVCIDFPPPNAGDPANTLASVELGEPVRVRIQKPFSFVPILGMGTITVRGSSTMRIERFAGTADSPTAYSDSQNEGTCSP